MTWAKSKFGRVDNRERNESDYDEHLYITESMDFSLLGLDGITGILGSANIDPSPYQKSVMNCGKNP